MVCIYCKSKTSTNNSRATNKGHQVWRRRSCPACHALFTTYETVDMSDAVSVKTPRNALEPFSRDKLMLSLYSSLSHRKTALSDAGQLCDTTISRLLPLIGSGVIDATAIAACAQNILEHFDNAGAIYYHSHHWAER